MKSAIYFATCTFLFNQYATLKSDILLFAISDSNFSLFSKYLKSSICLPILFIHIAFILSYRSFISITAFDAFFFSLRVKKKKVINIYFFEYFWSCNFIDLSLYRCNWRSFFNPTRSYGFRYKYTGGSLHLESDLFNFFPFRGHHSILVSSFVLVQSCYRTIPGVLPDLYYFDGVIHIGTRFSFFIGDMLQLDAAYHGSFHGVLSVTKFRCFEIGL